jgi:hypothetical protein
MLLKLKLALPRIIRSLSDTEVYFAAGDLAAAYLTAEYFGIAINFAAFVLAAGGRIYEAINDRKPLGLGFYAMAVVSAITVLSILANGIQLYSWDFLYVHHPEAHELLFGAAAFTCWTIANAVAGYKKSKSLPVGTLVANHQTYFCLGSIFATHAKLVPLFFFCLGLIQIIKGKQETLPTDINWQNFYRKHATPQRLRTIAYAISAIMVAQSDSRYIIPYLLWMLGNAVFHGPDDNSHTLKTDFIAFMKTQGIHPI